MQVRLHALELMRMLVPRSAVIRALVAHNFTEVVELVVGHRSSAPLPAPTKDAAILRELGLESVEQWSEEYGTALQQVCNLAQSC